MYVPYNEESATTEERIAWRLSEIIDDSAPLRWRSYIGYAACIYLNTELMRDLVAKAKEKGVALELVEDEE